MIELTSFINFYLIPGLVLGSIYALGAIGVSMVFGILRFAHFAHGDLMTLGAYFALTGVAVFGLHPLAALPLAILATSLAAVGIDRGFYKPFRARATIITVIASFGIALMIRSAVQLIWGVEITTYQSGIQRPMVFFDWLRISPRHLMIIAGSVVLVAAMHFFLTRTRTGKAMRAMSDDVNLARVTGIDTEATIRWTWVIGASLAAAAGVFLGMDTQLTPTMGWDMLLPIFAAALVGGIGRPYGAIFGGLLIGLAEELATYPWIGDAPLLSPAYKSAVAFFFLVVVLIWRPTGLFRGRVL